MSGTATEPAAASTERPWLDLLDGRWYIDGQYERYAWFRENQPIAWDDTNQMWGVFRLAHISEIESHDDVFINSGRESGYRPKIPADPAIIGLDNPQHAARRKLVSRRFTPRAVSSREDHVREIVTELLDSALERGRVDLVQDLASVLPAKIIGWLLGFPDDDWPKLRDWSERTIVMGGGPAYLSDDGLAATTEFVTSALSLYADKRACPADDVMSIWTSAEIDGQRVTERDVISDCLLLLDGGAETTRTVIARAILALIDRPDQWQLLRDGADLRVATDEFIRFVSPLHNMCRTATRDYDIAGVTIRRGQQVVLLYGSANRDPAHFTNPEMLDVTRTANPHIAFGLGTHFCLGAGLARLEIRVFFEEFVRRVQSVRLVPGEPVDELANSFVFGVNSATVELTSA